jgi:uncharacterized Zn finger protein
MNITLEKITNLIEDRDIKRGHDIVADGMIEIETVTPQSITAIAIDSGIYKIYVQQVDNSLTGNCTCPAYRDFGPCKHMAAACLAHMKSGYQSSKMYWEQKEQFTEIRVTLEKYTKEELIELFMRLGSYDCEFRRMMQEELRYCEFVRMIKEEIF